ncbi:MULTISPECIES: YbaB/EbfC family nucleoid-associated protein [unclassified Mycobacterium]|uniref:YbaB/EbfC family nucleoid-associated protein n=1 Tax=unclassified Mycobacterium TaxID=2642494 RepID=UPI0007FDF0B7|nr:MULTISPECIES: YbaB/EbfC family nucleoid-associated protein [unclassified Mycobacterium]OBH00151.1 DNA-binding protein [Mycobacterium sp. E3247]OBI17988.1 DNA-binding protein [Mycobacterium sp. E2497]
MTAGMHPQLAEAMEFGQRFQSALEDQIHRTNTETFTAADEANTVEVTLNARRGITDLQIEDGLLRLGAETVEQRVNEALRNAVAAVDAANEAQHRQLVESLARMTTLMTESLGLS